MLGQKTAHAEKPIIPDDLCATCDNKNLHLVAVWVYVFYMLRSTAIAIVMLTVFGITAAQDESRSDCPTISVTGPAGITQPGDLLRFTLSIDPEQSLPDLSFEWKVEGGTIVRGQGTKRLEVRPEKYFNKATIATVKATGLPVGCPSTASEIGMTVCDPYLVIAGDVFLWTQYSTVSWMDERRKLDSIVRDGLGRYPDHVIYLEKTFEEGFPQKNVDVRVRQIKIYLQKMRKLPKDRIFIRTFRGIRDFTTAYLVPLDAPVLSPNYAEPCLQ